MKNKQEGFILPLVIIIIAALAIGGGVYYAKKAKQAQQAQENTNVQATASSNTTASSTENNGQGTFKTFLSLNKDLTCTFSGAEGSNSVKGIVYVSGSNMRADTTMTGTTTSREAHIIRNGDAMMMWSGTQGIKMSVSDIDAASAKANSSASAQGSVDLNQKVNYNCVPWTPDQAQFSAPTAIKFLDMSALLKASTGIQAQLKNNIKVNGIKINQ